MTHNFISSLSSTETLTVYKQEICSSLSLLANKLHQVQLLLEKSQANEATVLIRQAVSDCETIILLI